jgi:hypothetical protein
VMDLYRRIMIAGECSENAPNYVFYSSNAHAVSVIATMVSSLPSQAGPLNAKLLVPGVKASATSSPAPLAVFCRGLLSAERNCSFAEFKKVLERHLKGADHTCVVCWESIAECRGALACPRCNQWVCGSCRGKMERPCECPHCRTVSHPEVFCCEECARRHYEAGMV